MLGSDTRREAIAGITTFFTMAYIVVVNPTILSDKTGISFSGALTATVLVCVTMTLLMGLYAKLPFAVAPGMGINAFFTYGVVLGMGVPWRTALGMVFWAGALFVVVSVTPLRVRLAQAIPNHLRTAAAVGIGLFLTFIGLKNAGLVVGDAVTLVHVGRLTPELGLAFAGFLVAVVLMRRKNPFAFLACIFVATTGAVALGRITVPEHLVAAPDFSSALFQLDIAGSIQLALLPAIVSILFTDLFDSLSTFIGVAHATGLTDERGQPKNLRQALLVDAVATLGAGAFGSSSGTAYIESAAGIEVGGRTGTTAVVTALCFVPCLFLAPLAGMVPAYATAPVLVLVGSLMWRSSRDLDFSRLEEAVPAFLTIVLIPLTFSITQGILWGFITHVALFTLSGRAREVGGWMWGIAAISVVLVALRLK